jgi:hypothetical protein
MTLFWVGIVGGLFIGASVGFVIAAMLAAHKRKDDYE